MTAPTPPKSRIKPRPYNPSRFSIFMDYAFVVYLAALIAALGYSSITALHEAMYSNEPDPLRIILLFISLLGVIVFACVLSHFCFAHWIPHLRRAHEARARHRQ